MSNKARRPEAARPVLKVDSLRAYYLTHYYGVEREVRAVDDIRLHRRPQRSLRAGRRVELRQDHAHPGHRRRHPAAAEVLGGTVKYSFLDRDLYGIDEATLAHIRWSHLACVLQGSMNVLNPVRRVTQVVSRLRLSAHGAQP